MESDGENNSIAMTGKISWYVVVVGTNQAPKNAGKVGLISMLLTMHLIFSGQKSFGNWFVRLRPDLSNLKFQAIYTISLKKCIFSYWSAEVIVFQAGLPKKSFKKNVKNKIGRSFTHPHFPFVLSRLYVIFGRKRIALGGGGNFRFPWLRPLEFRILHTYSCKHCYQLTQVVSAANTSNQCQRVGAHLSNHPHFRLQNAIVLSPCKLQSAHAVFGLTPCLETVNEGTSADRNQLR